jgi:hypothetical protein
MSPADDLRVDWFRLITDLNRAGHSTRRFADNLGIARTTIEGWKAGSEPKHADGERLIASAWGGAESICRELLSSTSGADPRPQ